MAGVMSHMMSLTRKAAWPLLAWVLVAGLVVAVLLSGCKGAAPAANREGSTDPKTPPAGRPEPEIPLSPITGLRMGNPGHAVAVSIDNLYPARPQSGLAQADIIYEVLAEGPVTRYLAIYLSEAPKTAGPIRSVRPYIALLAKEWDAVLAHCGGSDDGLRAIKEYGVVSANDMTHGGLYRRDSSREMPHNLYGDVETLRKVAEGAFDLPEKRYEFRDWAETPLAGLEVRYGKTYAVRYAYAGAEYERTVLDGSREPFVQADRDSGDTCAVSNVIVQFAKTRVLDKELRVAIDLIGEGKAVYLLGGRYLEGTWRKASVGEPTWFYTAEGNKIALTPGQTWVQVVPEGTQVSQLTAK